MGGSKRRALVLGGSGAVGREVVRGLSKAGVSTTFTWCRGDAIAEALAREVDARPLQVDFTDEEALSATLDAIVRDDPPDLLIGCAGAMPTGSFLELDASEWDRLRQVGVGAFRRAASALAPSMIERGGGDMVAVGGLDRAQSLPVPVAWAAVQGALSALVMALGKELGPANIRVNMVALGPLEGGLLGRLDPKVQEDYLRFSALRRLGRPEEAAAAILWLALRNTYVSGEVLPVNGGI